MSGKKLKVFSTFSGVGGLDHPFAWDNNFEVIGFSEIDKHASAVLKYHYAAIPNYGDITKIDFDKLPEFDILLGGFPCQDISYQGKQEGILLGKKSSLFKYLVKILETKKPKYFLFENVEALLHINDGWDFDYVKKELTERGYAVRWEVFDSSDFGVPQQRKRVFILGFDEKERSPEDDLISSLYRAIKVQSEQGRISDWRDVKGFPGYKINSFGEVYSDLGSKLKNNWSLYNKTLKPGYFLKANNKMFLKTTLDLVYENFVGAIPENKEVSMSGPSIQISADKLKLIKKSKSPFEHVVKEIKTGMFEAETIDKKSIGVFTTTAGASNAYYWYHKEKYGEIPWDAKKVISWSKSTREKHLDYRIRQDGFYNTLTGGKGCNGFSTGNLIEEAGNVRILSPEECEQLMSLADGWTQVGDYNGQIKQMPISQRYKQCGNAVVSACVVPIKDFILKLERKECDFSGNSYHG